MAKDRDNLADGFDTDNSGGWLAGFLAEEDDLDRRSLWRLGSWGVGSVAAVVVAVMASQSSIGARRDQIASADLVRQSQQIQSVAKDSQSEARRLASAIDTLNGDRDRLYSRVTVLEQGLDSVTGSIARQNSAAGSPQAGPSLLSALEQPAFLRRRRPLPRLRPRWPPSPKNRATPPRVSRSKIRRAGHCKRISERGARRDAGHAADAGQIDDGASGPRRDETDRARATA